MLKFYNTMTRSLEEFIPGGVKKNSIGEYAPVTIYSCGPTVYGYAHIGNFRTYTFNDILRRYLKFRGYKVDHAMNITDVDDKIIERAAAEKMSIGDFTKKFTDIFLDDLAALNIEKVEHLPTATGSIDAMDDIINRLGEKGIVYEQDGSLYFSISKFKDYGKLSRLESREIKAGERNDADEYDKDDLRDFALWKAPKSDSEPSWTIKKGKGRPGWHIECSAMVRKIFGATIDIHTGGVDLIFPHHENEIAQSEAAYGDKFVRYWIHWEHLLSEGTKMSKSLGNIYLLSDLIAKGFSARSIRYLLMSAHYRKQLNFTLEGLKAATQALEKIDNFTARVSGIKEGTSTNDGVIKACDSFLEQFTSDMDNDLNLAGALGKLFEFIREANSLMDKSDLSAKDAEYMQKTLAAVDAVFGVIFFPQEKADDADAERYQSLIMQRNDAKAKKDFAAADKIRNDLLAEGIILEDGKDGTRWKRKN
jgi:cysteinyl-tRNA synthetase